VKRIEINLAKTFPDVLATLLGLPSTATEAQEMRLPGSADSARRGNGKCDAQVTEAFRSLYEAANGRPVETRLGFIAIAPPVAGFLKNQPYYVATQYEFFLEAFARILAEGSPPRDERTVAARTRGGKLLPRRRGTNVRHNQPGRGNRTVLLRSRTTRIANNHS